jgi:hypothetical protein
MDRGALTPFTRRRAATAAALGGLLTLAAGARREAGALPRAGVGSGGGVAGGGTVTVDGRAVGCLLFATRLQSEGESDTQVFGSIEWSDPDAADGPLVLATTAVTSYDSVDDDSGTREIAGMIEVAGDEHPFVLRVVDAGPLGEGEETVALLVGSESGPIYSATGTFAAGGVMLLDFEAPPA